jgi:DNA polymerase-1
MLVQIDSAQLEWRVAVFLSGDPIGIAELNDRDANPDDPEKDIHEKNRRVLQLPERLIAKRFLFRTIFRGSGWAFAHDPDFFHVSKDPKYWDGLNEAFFAKYSGLDNTHQTWARLVASRRPIQSPLGMEWMVPLRPNGDIPWTTLSNWPVQGTGADIVMIARVILRNRLRQLGSTSLAVNTVHDSIVYDCPTVEEIKRVATTAIAAFRDVSSQIERIFHIKVPISFPGEVKLGPTLDEKTMTSYQTWLAQQEQ